jgi:hypothetical protein
MSWANPPLWEVRPERACFAGDAYTVVAAFDNTVQPTVSTTFEFAGQSPVTTDVGLTPAGSSADAVVQVAASARLPHLVEEERKAWAVSHQLITDQTDCLITVVRSAEERSTEQPELQVMPQMLPAGWGGTSSVVSACRSMTYDVAPAFMRSSRSSRVRYSMPVMSMCLRTNTDYLPSDDEPENPYLTFLKTLSVRSTRKLIGKLPRCKNDLLKLNAPADVIRLFDVLVSEGHSEVSIMNSLLQALVEHNGSVLLTDEFITKVNSTLSSQPADRELVAHFRLVLNDIWMENGSATVIPPDRFDIPAFLRKQSD